MSGKLALVRLLYWLRGFFESPGALFKELGVSSGDAILEVGCAIGYHTLPLADLAVPGQVYAADIWAEGLAYLQSRAGTRQNIVALHGGAETVELPASSLDKVVCFDTLHDIPDVEQALETWARLLRPGRMMLYRDPEISPEKVALYSAGRLELAGSIKGVHVFVRRSHDAFDYAAEDAAITEGGIR